MRKWLIFLSICLSCNSKEETQEQPAVYEAPENEEWIVYEGVVRSDEGNDIKIALSLLQNSTGMESQYKTEEEFIGSQDERLLTHRSGTYTILYGSDDKSVITLNPAVARSLGWQPAKGYSIDPKLASEEIQDKAQISKLAFITSRNSNELILIDEGSNPMASDNRYTLKRRSILFTVEGFVTIEPSVTDFFEFNTRESWIVARSGAYGEVQKKYIEFATTRHEGIYTKAVAFYVDDIDSTGAEVRSLVIKKIIAMKAHKDYVSE
jgi:hypothetical protein